MGLVEYRGPGRAGQDVGLLWQAMGSPEKVVSKKVLWSLVFWIPKVFQNNTNSFTLTAMWPWLNSFTSLGLSSPILTCNSNPVHSTSFLWASNETISTEHLKLACILKKTMSRLTAGFFFHKCKLSFLPFVSPEQDSASTVPSQPTFSLSLSLFPTAPGTSNSGPARQNSLQHLAADFSACLDFIFPINRLELQQIFGLEINVKEFCVLQYFKVPHLHVNL